MPSHRNTYLILLLCATSISVYAKPQYVFQSENPIANFAKKYPSPLRNSEKSSKFAAFLVHGTR